MSKNALRIQVERQFKNNWQGTPMSRVDFGANSPFDPPAADTWVRLVINEFDTQNAEVGTDFTRTDGLLVVQCFAPLKTGEATLSQLVDSAAAVFENQNFDDVRCFATAAIRVGRTKNWYQINARTPFLYDVIS